MRILYLSSHEVLEYQELRMLTEMKETLNAGPNIEVFSLNGAYMNPTQSGGFMRSVIPKGRFYPKLYSTALQCDKDDIHPELLEWADIVLMMHNSAIPGQKEQQRWLVRNWPKFDKLKKRVVWRSIGQSTPATEEELQQYRNKGLKILRYSPLEEKIPNYAGADGLIRFAEDSTEFGGWIGERKQVLTIAQSFKQRGDHLGYHIFERVTAGLPTKVIGTENENLGELWLGPRSYHELIEELRQARVFFYFGTVPAPYTLSFIEAMMMGIPIVAVGNQLREHNAYRWPNYEIPEIITNGVNGYVSNDIQELKGFINLLLEDKARAIEVGKAGRETAIKLFEKKDRMKEWSEFLKMVYES